MLLQVIPQKEWDVVSLLKYVIINQLSFLFYFVVIYFADLSFMTHACVNEEIFINCM